MDDEPPYHLPVEKMAPEGQRHWRDETLKTRLLTFGDQMRGLAMIGVPLMAVAAAADWVNARGWARRQAALQRQAAANLARLQQHAAHWRQLPELGEAAAGEAPPGAIPGLAPRHMVMRGLVARSASPAGRRTG